MRSRIERRWRSSWMRISRTIPGRVIFLRDAGRRAGPVSELERRREARRRAHRAAARRAVARAGAATSEPPPAPPAPTPPAPARATTHGAAHQHHDGGEGGFLSAAHVREAKRQHARHDRRVERRVESREDEKEEKTKRNDAAEGGCRRGSTWCGDGRVRRRRRPRRGGAVKAGG